MLGIPMPVLELASEALTFSPGRGSPARARPGCGEGPRPRRAGPECVRVSMAVLGTVAPAAPCAHGAHLLHLLLGCLLSKRLNE